MSLSVHRRDLDSLLHPRGPLELPEETVAWLDRRTASEAFLAKHAGSFACRIEEASWLPRPERTPSEEAWLAAQREEQAATEAAHLAQLRLRFGEDFDE